ncbi:hypothetical protein LIER_37756 [Lithospermum erythrorhizon]|uniref:Uncharacterized protein n=1 Tax=Lithospermum erythrorhizon TaxID=34254 RepID=A0AAV3PS23_LITER
MKKENLYLYNPFHLRRLEMKRLLQVAPIVDDTCKTQNPSSESVERVGSTETLLSPVEGNKYVEKNVENRFADTQLPDVENVYGEEVDATKKVSREGDGVNPSVKDTSDETSYKSAKTHSSIDPTVVEIMAGMRGVKSVKEAAVDSPIEEEVDDIVVVSYTTSKNRRRTRTSIAALEKKRVALAVGGVNEKANEEPEKVVDVEELEKLAEMRKAVKIEKVKVKRPSTNQAWGFVPKKRKRVVILEPKSPRRGDKFVVDDAAKSDEEVAAKVLRERSKVKLKVNDNRNRINNRRITKDVDDVPGWISVLKSMRLNGSLCVRGIFCQSGSYLRSPITIRPTLTFFKMQDYWELCLKLGLIGHN